MDDGSSDDTLRLMNALAERDAAVVPLSLSRNFGQAIALSAGRDGRLLPRLAVEPGQD